MSGLPIGKADREKWLFRIAMNWVRKHYAEGKNKDIIHDEMRNCGNPFVRYVLRLMDEVKDNIPDEKHQRKMIEEFGEFGLWVLAYEDTAYRQPFFWMMKKILDDKEKLYPIVEKYYKEPYKWFVNQWSKGKKFTEDEQEEGKISKSEFSNAEKYFVPDIQNRRDMTYSELDKEKKKRGIK